MLRTQKAMSQSRSAACPRRSPGAHKKSWSSAEVTTNIGSKKRGMYVANHTDSEAIEEAVTKPQQSTLKHPRHSQKRFVESILNIQTQECTATQCPDFDWHQIPAASHKHIRIRKRVPVDTADTGTQDLDATVWSRETITNSRSTASSPQRSPLRNRRFRSRALSLNLNENLQLSEQNSSVIILPNTDTIYHAKGNTSSPVKAKLGPITPKLDQKKSVHSNKSKAFSKTHVISIPNSRTQSQTRKSKIRIVEPIDVSEKPAQDQLYESFIDLLKDASKATQDKNDMTQERHEKPDFVTWRPDFQSARPSNHIARLQDHHKTTFPTIDVDSGDARKVYFAVNEVPHIRNRKQYLNFNNNIQVAADYKPTALRRQFEKKQTKQRIINPEPRTNKKKKSKLKGKEKRNPLLEQLRSDLEMEADWFEEPDNMHDALLKVASQKKRARQLLKELDQPAVFFADYSQKNKIANHPRTNNRKVVAIQRFSKSKPVNIVNSILLEGNKKKTVQSSVYIQHRRSPLVINATEYPDQYIDEEYKLYEPLDSSMTVKVDQHENPQESTERIYLGGTTNVDDVDSTCTLEGKDSSLIHSLKMEFSQNYSEEPLHNPDLSLSTSFTSTGHSLMTPQSLD